MRNKEAVVVFLVFILALTIRLFICLNSDNHLGSIAAGRVIDAIDTLRNPALKNHLSSAAPPTYNYLLAFSLYIWNNPLISPRLVSVIFGALLIFPFYYLIKQLFDNETALLSTILLCVYPLHVFQSVISTSEATFCFFLFSCLFFFFKFYNRMSGIGYLIISIILFNIASSIRFEAWIFLPVLTILVFIKSKRHSLVFFLCSSIFPLSWIVTSSKLWHNPFISFTWPSFYNRLEIHAAIKRGDYPAPYLLDKILGYLRTLNNTLPPYVAILGFYGLLRSFFKREQFMLGVLFVVAFSALEYKLITNTLFLRPRYSITMGLMLIPYSVVAMTIIWKFILKGNQLLKKNLEIRSIVYKRLMKLGFVVFFLVIVLKGIEKSVATRPICPGFVKYVSSYLNAHAKANDRVIIDWDKFFLFTTDIIVHSGLNPSKFLVVSPAIWGLNELDKMEILEFLKQEKPRYLVLFPGCQLQPVFNFSGEKEVESAYGFRFNLLCNADGKEYGKFLIYEISQCKSEH